MKEGKMTHIHHEHNYHTHKNLKRLSIVLVITIIYMFAEFIGGYFTNSLALTADAGHMLGDSGSLALSFAAIWLATKKAPIEKSFGYYRAEIIAAFLNGLTLVLIAALIMYEAYQRLMNVHHVFASGMLIISVGGLVVNIIGAYLLHKGSGENLNVKGAFLHIMADLLGSIGAITAGLLMYFFKWYLADPIISFVIAILVLSSSFGILKSAVDILMESVPSDIDIKEVQKSIENIENVQNVHDLHIWCINANTIALSVHLVTELTDYKEILSKTNEMLEHKFGIEHATIQIEPVDFHENTCAFENHH
ncbi:MAG: cation diffusion facilitator family transporter [Clostridiaceae bacterium]|nr:cation diffusion facilitator family transporter [Clostridiaceae bacterium]